MTWWQWLLIAWLPAGLLLGWLIGRGIAYADRLASRRDSTPRLLLFSPP